jgi:hypothetical protein
MKLRYQNMAGQANLQSNTQLAHNLRILWTARHAKVGDSRRTEDHASCETKTAK